MNQEESEQNEVDGMQEKAERSRCVHMQRQAVKSELELRKYIIVSK